MRFKNSRFGPRLVEAARAARHYPDVHDFIGGTGADGGSAAQQMVEMLEEKMVGRAPPELLAKYQELKAAFNS